MKFERERTSSPLSFFGMSTGSTKTGQAATQSEKSSDPDRGKSSERSENQAPVVCLDHSQLMLDFYATICAQRELPLLHSNTVVGALDLIQKEGASAVITVQYLPDYLGASLIAALKTAPKYKNIPVALVSSNPSDMDFISDIQPDEIIPRHQVRTKVGSFFDRFGFPLLKKSNSPKDEATATSSIQTEQSSSPAPLAPKVLLTEDSPIIQFLVGKILQSTGIDLTIANSGKEALETLDKSPDFDLVLMDIEMPEMDGREAIVEIRGRGLTLPVVALTGHDAEQFEEEGNRLGFTDILQKPIKPPLLISICSRYLHSQQKAA